MITAVPLNYFSGEEAVIYQSIRGKLGFFDLKSERAKSGSAGSGWHYRRMVDEFRPHRFRSTPGSPALLRISEMCGPL
jgi:hypothetical protein